MTNFAIVLVIAAFICATNVHVYADEDNNNNDGLPSLFGRNWKTPLDFSDFKMPNLTFPPVKPPNPLDIINLKPKDDNTKVSGTYSGYSSSVEMKDGHVVKQSSSSKNIDNKNGTVTEVDSSN